MSKPNLPQGRKCHRPHPPCMTISQAHSDSQRPAASKSRPLLTVVGSPRTAEFCCLHRLSARWGSAGGLRLASPTRAILRGCFTALMTSCEPGCSRSRAATLRSPVHRLEMGDGFDEVLAHGTYVVGVYLHADNGKLFWINCQRPGAGRHAFGQGDGRTAMEASERLTRDRIDRHSGPGEIIPDFGYFNAKRIREPRLTGDVVWKPFPGVWDITKLPIEFEPAG